MEIYVEMSGFDSTQSKYNEIIRELDSVQTSFRSVTSTLDWNVKSKANIQKYINILNGELSSLRTTVNAYSNFINDSKENYISAENYNEQETNKLKNDLFGGKYKTGGSSSVIPKTDSGKDEEKNDNLDWKKVLSKSIDGILSLISKYGPESGLVKIGMAAEIISVIKNLGELYSKYKSGVNSKSLFVLDIMKSGKKIGSAGIGITKNINKYYKGLNLAKSTVAKLGKASIVLNVIGVGLDSVYQGIESYDQYNADGNMSGKDWRDLLIDVGSKTAFSGAAAGLSIAATLLAGTVGAPVTIGLTVGGIALSFANSAFDLDGKVASGIKYAVDVVGNVTSAIADKVGDVANGIKNAVGEKIKSVGDFVSGCKSILPIPKRGFLFA